MGEDRDELPKLLQAGGGYLFRQMRLPGKNDLQELLLRSLEVREHPYELQDCGAEILRLVHHHHDALAHRACSIRTSCSLDCIRVRFPCASFTPRELRSDRKRSSGVRTVPSRNKVRAPWRKQRKASNSKVVFPRPGAAITARWAQPASTPLEEKRVLRGACY
jgi:hypothetical protein